MPGPARRVMLIVSVGEATLKRFDEPVARYEVPIS
jgi:hypothetical protein